MSQDEPSPNRKNPKKKKQTKPASPKKPAKLRKLPSADKLNVASLSAFLMMSEDPCITDRRKAIEHMSAGMQEYLSSYMLIGYTMDGHPINVTYAPTPKDYDSLSTNLQRYILDSFSSSRFPPPPPGFSE